MARSRPYHSRAALKDHGNGWFTETERFGANVTYVAYQLDSEGYTVPGTHVRRGYARETLAYVATRKHEPQPIRPPAERTPAQHRMQTLMDRIDSIRSKR